MDLRKVFKHLLPYGIVQLYERNRNIFVDTNADARWRPLNRKHDECIVLANGPSMQTQLNEIRAYAKHADVLTVNSSLKSKDIRNLRPIAHFCADQGFFIPGYDYWSGPFPEFSKDMAAMFSLVDWPMNLYVPTHFYDAAVALGYATNCVQIVTAPLAPPPSDLPPDQKYRLMNAGIFGVGGQDGALFPLYLAVTARYKRIWLAGLDASFMHTSFVDEDCRLYYLRKYGYDNVGQKVYCPFPMTELIHKFYVASVQYDFLKEYADHCGVQIINLSLASIRDFTPKGKLGEDPRPWLRGRLPEDLSPPDEEV